VVHYAEVTSFGKLAPHDLRRTCAKLYRKAGGDLELSPERQDAARVRGLPPTDRIAPARGGAMDHGVAAGTKA
jgi:hypothetical protein